MSQVSSAQSCSYYFIGTYNSGILSAKVITVYLFMNRSLCFKKGGNWIATVSEFFEHGAGPARATLAVGWK
jgi:hypothetical protein